MKTAALSVALWALTGLAGAQGVPTTAIGDLAWMAGRWMDDSGGDVSEETWLPPSGDCMVGMWRWVSGGKAKLYEFLTMTQDADEIAFRLRHFDRRSVGWEDKDEPLVLRLVASKEKEAVFEGSGTAGFLRLTYRRTADDALVSVLERGTSEKDAKRQEFRFRRKPL